MNVEKLLKFESQHYSVAKQRHDQKRQVNRTFNKYSARKK